NEDNARAGARLAFGKYVDCQYRLDQADIILSLDSDFLNFGPRKLRSTRVFAQELEQHRRRSLVIAGAFQPPEVHALAHQLNDALGNVGATIVYTDPVEPQPAEQTESLRQLAS